jgi:hypothetical protein
MVKPHVTRQELGSVQMDDMIVLSVLEQMQHVVAVPYHDEEV